MPSLRRFGSMGTLLETRGGSMLLGKGDLYKVHVWPVWLLHPHLNVFTPLPTWRLPLAQNLLMIALANFHHTWDFIVRFFKRTLV